MNKNFKIKSSNGRGLQMFGVMSVILATLASFAYLIPESDTTATEAVLTTNAVTSTTPVFTSATTIASTSATTTISHTTTVRTTTSATTTATTTTETTTTETTTLTTTTATTTSATTQAETTTASAPVSMIVSETSSSLQNADEEFVNTSLTFEIHEHETDDYECDYEEDCDYNYDESESSNYDENYEDDEKSETEGERRYLGTFRITHYCPCSVCCGEYTGLTASGTYATAGRTVSASSQFEFGTQLEIDGNVYTVEDRGGFSENTIDIFCDSHEEALEKGSYYADVYIVE